MGTWDIDAALIAKVRGKPLQEAVSLWDRGLDRDIVRVADEQRAQVMEHFAIEAWAQLPLERYALGTDVDDSFCKLMEFRSQALGGIGGGSALKHMIYRKSDGSWYHRPEYGSVEEAWETLYSMPANAPDVRSANWAFILHRQVRHAWAVRVDAAPSSRSVACEEPRRAVGAPLAADRGEWQPPGKRYSRGRRRRSQRKPVARPPSRAGVVKGRLS